MTSGLTGAFRTLAARSETRRQRRERGPLAPGSRCARLLRSHTGGTFVPEVLVEALVRFGERRGAMRRRPRLLERTGTACCRTTSARPSPTIYHADAAGRRNRTPRSCSSREDTNHTGAHKINNTVGQALLARRNGKAPADRGDGRRTARRRHRNHRGEDGDAGRRLHGRGRCRTASAQRLFDEAARRDGPPGPRAETRTLKDATNEAFR